MGDQTDRLEKMLVEIDRDYYSHDRSKFMAKLEAEQALALARIADSLEWIDSGGGVITVRGNIDTAQ